MPVSQVFCRVELAFFTTALTPKSWNLPWNTRPATACAWHCLRARWHSRATLATGDLPAYSSTPWKKIAVENFCRSTLLFLFSLLCARGWASRDPGRSRNTIRFPGPGKKLPTAVPGNIQMLSRRHPPSVQGQAKSAHCADAHRKRCTADKFMRLRF